MSFHCRYKSQLCCCCFFYVVITSAFKPVFQCCPLPFKTHRRAEKEIKRGAAIGYCMRKRGGADKYVRVLQNMYEHVANPGGPEEEIIGCSESD